MTSDFNEHIGYSTNILGKLKNTSNKEYSYVCVTFAIFDANDAQIGQVIDNLNYLQPGNTWQFNASAFALDEAPYSCKLVDVTIW